jgi:UPF0716 protein FxsA
VNETGATLGRLLFLAFLIVPLIEIACFILIGQAIGLWPTLLGVLVTAVLGSVLLRYQGLQLLNEIRGTMARGMLPARALADAMMVAVAAVLLITPGYFTDLLGILLLVPPVRAAIYGFLKTRIRVVAPGVAYGRPQDPADRRAGTIDLDEGGWRER